LAGAVASTGLDHVLPWYFGVAVFGVWAAVLLALAYLLRHRMHARAKRRALSRRAAPEGPEIADDRSLGPGTDVEPW
jgi:hypothetical protein